MEEFPFSRTSGPLGWSLGEDDNPDERKTATLRVRRVHHSF